MSSAAVLLLAAALCSAQDETATPAGSADGARFAPAPGTSAVKADVEDAFAKESTARPKKAKRRRTSGVAAVDGPDSAVPDAEAPPPSAKTEAASKKAVRLADALRSSMPAPEAAAAGAAPGAPPSGTAPGAAPNPAKPTNERELRLSAAAGYGDAFKKVGLSVGRLPDGGEAVVEKDGSPASAARLAELAAAVRAEPKSLMKRPDFFTVLPREKYAALKDAYARPETKATVFKDVVLSKRGRDFRWSATCETLSGACNPAALGSYRKGENPAPEELSRMYAALAGGADAAADRGAKDAEAVERARRASSSGFLESLSAALTAALGGEGPVVGLGDGRPRESVAVGAPAPGRPLDGAAVPLPEPPSPTRALWPWLLVAACAVLAWGLVRRT